MIYNEIENPLVWRGYRVDYLPSYQTVTRHTIMASPTIPTIPAITPIIFQMRISLKVAMTKPAIEIAARSIVTNVPLFISSII